MAGCLAMWHGVGACARVCGNLAGCCGMWQGVGSCNMMRGHVAWRGVHVTRPVGIWQVEGWGDVSVSGNKCQGVG